MAVSIKPKSVARKAHVDNITVGYAELPAVHDSKGIRWAIPGYRYIRSKKKAIEYATWLDRKIQKGIKTYRRSLI